jgi:hypothetical protein
MRKQTGATLFAGRPVRTQHPQQAVGVSLTDILQAKG